MSRKKPVDLDAVKTFFDPHPGFAGATIPLPAAVKKVVDELDGRKLTLRQALDKFRAVTRGKVKVVQDGDYIGLLLEGSGCCPTHFFRLIRFR